MGNFTPRIVAGHGMPCPYEEKPVANGRRHAKDHRRARLISQARLTVDLGALPAVPLRNLYSGAPACGDLLFRSEAEDVSGVG